MPKFRNGITQNSIKRFCQAWWNSQNQVLEWYVGYNHSWKTLRNLIGIKVCLERNQTPTKFSSCRVRRMIPMSILVIAGPATAAREMNRLDILNADERFSLPTKSPKPRARKLNADPEETTSATRLREVDWNNNNIIIINEVTLNNWSAWLMTQKLYRLWFDRSSYWVADIF